MKILISGANGLIGKELVNFFSLNQHQVFKLVRKRTSLQKDEIFWDIKKEVIDLNQLEGFDAVIHLAGESIIGKWTKEKKKKIENSRVKGTEFLCRSLSQIHAPPQTFISASAIGYYGDHGSSVITEQSTKGKGFLANVCQKWEEATALLAKKEVRIVQVRTAVVMSQKGGALKKMLTPFNCFLGAQLGSGEQYMSWIALDDLVAIYSFILNHPSIRGAINGTSPYPITNEEFTNTLAKVLHRSAFLKLPEFVLKKILGEMAEELLLVSQRARPTALMEQQFSFTYPLLEQALNHMV